SFLGLFTNLTIVKLIGGLTTLSALIRDIFQKKKIDFFLTSQSLCFLILTCYVILTGFIKPGSNTRETFTKFGSFIMFYYLLVSLVDNYSRIRIIVWSCISAMVWASFLALAQFVFKGGGDARPGALFGDSNYFAISLLVVISMAYYRIEGEYKKRFKVLAVIFILILISGLMLTLSRGGILGFLVGIIAVSLKKQEKWKGILFLIIIINSTLLLMPQTFWKRVEMTKIRNTAVSDKYNEAFVSTERRIKLAKGALAMFISNPIIGVGPGNFFWNSRQYAHIVPGMAHNMYLEVLAEMGMIGFPLFISIIFFTLKDLKYIIANSILNGSPNMKNLADSLQVGLISFLVSGVFLHAEYEKFFWLSIFLTLILKKKMQESEI
ncbi:O-antigen ligase family protein, partial [Candidatus Desantisbacteria bacterium]|nr:O-antigen ligase family protein [Candidatus Desantisbacteria bacterium]